MNKRELQKVMSWLGRRSYKKRLARFGIERMRDHARTIGKLGGRPRAGKRGRHGGGA